MVLFAPAREAGSGATQYGILKSQKLGVPIHCRMPFVRWQVVLQEIAEDQNSGKEANAAVRLRRLLEERFELRLECSEVLASLPESCLDANPLLWRACGLNELEHGRYAEAEQCIRRAQVQATPQEHLDCLLDRALIARDRTDWSGCLRLVDEADRAGPNPDQKLRVLNFRAVYELAYRFDLDRARRYFRDIETLAMASGNRTAYLTALINRGLGIERVQGEFNEMLNCAAEIGRHYGGQIPAEDRIYQGRLQAEALLGLGHADSLSACQNLIALGLEHENANALGYGYGLAAYVCADRGDWAGVRSFGEKCTQLALPFNVMVIYATVAEALRLSAEGEVVRAEQLLKETLEKTEALDRRVQVLIELGKLGDREALGEAKFLAEKLGAHFDLLRIKLLGLLAVFDRDQAVELMTVMTQFPGEVLLRRMPREAGSFCRRCLIAGLTVDAAAGLLRQLNAPFLIIRTFGCFEVRTHKREIRRSDWTRPRARTLFAYLVAQLPSSVSVQQIADDLWPEMEPEQQRNALRVAASYVRKALEFDCISIEDGLVKLELPEHTWIDHMQLRRAARTPDPEAWRRALDEVSDGHALADIADHWVHNARDRLEELRAAVVRKLTG